MRYKTTILVSPFGHAYYLGENHEPHDEEYFRKTWEVIWCAGKYRAQSKANSSIWDLEVFDDEGHSIENPCVSCQHEFEIELETRYTIVRRCPKCLMICREIK